MCTSLVDSHDSRCGWQVAKIVAETMHGYMMFGRTLVCQFVEPAQVGVWASSPCMC